MSRTVKSVAAVCAIAVALAAALFGCLFYMTRGKTETMDTAQSSDAAYELTLQSVGAPDWPFGSAYGRLVLHEGNRLISSTRIEIANDGAPITEDVWNVSWYGDRVEILLSGEEQFDELVTLYFDGQTESQRLDTHFGRESWYRSAEENAGEAEDEPEQELFPGQWQIEAGYFAICAFFFDGLPEDIEVSYGAAESSSMCLLSETEDVAEYLVYDRESQNRQCGLYVYYQSEKDGDGAWDCGDGTILDIYAYVHETGAVVSSGKTQWTDTGSDAYREAAGED